MLKYAELSMMKNWQPLRAGKLCDSISSTNNYFAYYLVFVVRDHTEHGYQRVEES